MKNNSLADHIRELFGDSVRIRKRTPVSGGDINRAFRLELSDDSCLFVKENRASLTDMFASEAEGLEALGSGGVIPVVKALGYGTDDRRNCSYLLLEYVGGRMQSRTFWEDFGRELALLHRQDTDAFSRDGRFGFIHDNYIGMTPQSNRSHDSFISFFREERLLPQVQMAESWFERSDRACIDRLIERLDVFLIEPDFPSLLHGDLWGGNFLTGPDGGAVLIDPAAYVGCAEADLAMTELFGGFSVRFYDAYREVSPVAPGYEDRRDLYNLYHLLNHLNLFGGGYLSSVMRVAKYYAG